jgi:hypothetical protein
MHKCNRLTKNHIWTKAYGCPPTKMASFDHLKCVFFLAKMLEQKQDVQITFEEYNKYLNVWNQLDETTQERYTIYANLENPISHRSS